MKATAARVTNRGKEACEDVRKRWVWTISLPRLFSPRPARLRTETLYEADVSGEWAADHEASPEDGAEVHGELGQR